EWYGMLLHEGHFNEPVLRDIEMYFMSSQNTVTGTVRVKLAPYNFTVLGVRSEYDLMSDVFGSYGEMNNAWSGDDVRGFSKIASNQVMIHQKIQELADKK
ncbi:MAG: argininosuccinate synthase, partial [Leadbetterella sp.]|nr:argininosuccinate synthase [Leadbetterella sp.]